MIRARSACVLAFVAGALFASCSDRPAVPHVELRRGAIVATRNHIRHLALSRAGPGALLVWTTDTETSAVALDAAGRMSGETRSTSRCDAIATLDGDEARFLCTRGNAITFDGRAPATTLRGLAAEDAVTSLAATRTPSGGPHVAWVSRGGILGVDDLSGCEVSADDPGRAGVIRASRPGWIASSPRWNLDAEGIPTLWFVESRLVSSGSEVEVRWFRDGAADTHGTSRIDDPSPFAVTVRDRELIAYREIDPDGVRSLYVAPRTGRGRPRRVARADRSSSPVCVACFRDRILCASPRSHSRHGLVTLRAIDPDLRRMSTESQVVRYGTDVTNAALTCLGDRGVVAVARVDQRTGVEEIEVNTVRLADPRPGTSQEH